MARLMALREDVALLPRQTSSTSTVPSSILPPSETGPSSTGPETNPSSSTIPNTIITATPTSTTTPTSSSMTSTAIVAPASSSAPPTAAPPGGGPSGTMLAEIIAPIAFIVILAPIVYMLWLRNRTRKNMSKLESEPRHSPSPSREPKVRSASPRRSIKPSFLPPLFLHERGQAKEVSLFDEVRVSMESAQRKEPTSHFDRDRDDIRAKESSYGVYSLRRSLEDKGRTDSIGLFDLPRSNERASPAQPTQRGPSPTLPSPKVPLFERPPSEAWPLPASKLPDPPTLYDPHMNTKKPSQTYGSPSGAPPPIMPLPATPGSRQDNQTYSFASSNLAPSQSSSHQYQPSSNTSNTGYNNIFGSGANRQYPSASSASHSETNHLLNPSISSQHLNATPLESPSSVYNTPAVATFSPLNPDEHRGRHRDSDLVSELSYRSPSSERDQRRTSADAVSVVSAISHRRRRSEREADALSMISALSPETEDTPRIPIEHYPRS